MKKKLTKKQREQLYCKEKNLLQLPLFCFEKTKKKGFEIIWKENNKECKVVCSTHRDLPGSLEMDLFSACMRIWVRQKMPAEGIEIENSDVASVLGLDYRSWCTKIKKSILKLGAARYEFVECFVDAKNRKITSIKQFSLFGGTEVNEVKNKGCKINKYRVTFPEEIKVNLEKGYYQWLDFELYKRLKTGIARRLYEFLEKRRYHNVDNKFSIGEEKIFRWLPLLNSNVRQGRKTLKKAIESLLQEDYLESYELNSKSKFWSFTYARKIKNKKRKKCEDNPSVNLIDKRKEELQFLLKELKNLTENMKKTIENYHSEKGFNYVLWNIRYTNANAQKSYLTYLRRALKENWAVDWKEEQLKKAVEKKLLDKEQAGKYQEEMNKRIALEEQKTLFETEHNKLSFEEKEVMWNSAERSINKKEIGRGMLIKIEYRKLIEEKFKEMGLDFNQEAISSLEFTKKIAVEPKR